MERLGHDGKLAHVGRYTLYVTPAGQLVMSTGNVRLDVTPQEAREMLDFMLLWAERFHTGIPATNGQVDALAGGRIEA